MEDFNFIMDSLLEEFERVGKKLLNDNADFTNLYI